MENTKELDKVPFNSQKWKDALPKNVSRRKFAATVETTDSNLISIEKGKSLPSLVLAYRYCKKTNLKLDELFIAE